MGSVEGRHCILGVGVAVGGLIMLRRGSVPRVVMGNPLRLGVILGRTKM